jgi:hypothetical protein
MDGRIKSGHDGVWAKPAPISVAFYAISRRGVKAAAIMSGLHS